MKLIQSYARANAHINHRSKVGGRLANQVVMNETEYSKRNRHGRTFKRHAGYVCELVELAGIFFMDFGCRSLHAFKAGDDASEFLACRSYLEGRRFDPFVVNADAMQRNRLTRVIVASASLASSSNPWSGHKQGACMRV